MIRLYPLIVTPEGVAACIGLATEADKQQYQEVGADELLGWGRVRSNLCEGYAGRETKPSKVREILADQGLDPDLVLKIPGVWWG